MARHPDFYIAKKFLAKAESCVSRGIEFNLSFTSYKNLMRAKKCAVTGIPFAEKCKPHEWNQRTIDRIDSTKPYEAGNVVAVLHGVNRVKSAVESDSGLDYSVFGKLDKFIKKRKST